MVWGRMISSMATPLRAIEAFNGDVGKFQLGLYSLPASSSVLDLLQNRCMSSLLRGVAKGSSITHSVSENSLRRLCRYSTLPLPHIASDLVPEKVSDTDWTVERGPRTRYYAGISSKLHVSPLQGICVVAAAADGVGAVYQQQGLVYQQADQQHCKPVLLLQSSEVSAIA
jgi:hypothetical protein